MVPVYRESPGRRPQWTSIYHLPGILDGWPGAKLRWSLRCATARSRWRKRCTFINSAKRSSSRGNVRSRARGFAVCGPPAFRNIVNRVGSGKKNGARVTSILPVQLNHHQRRMPPPSPTNHNREITKNSKQRDDEASPVHGGADADACCVRGFDRSPSFHCVSPRPFNRRLASASPRSRARRYQKRASVGSLLAPRKTSQPRKAGWKVAPSRSAAWPSPALAARS